MENTIDEFISATRKRTAYMAISDDESSTDKSKKTRTRHAKPLEYSNRRIVESVSAEYDDDQPPEPAPSEPSIGNIGEFPQSEYEASDDEYDNDLSQPNHHKSVDFDDEEEVSDLPTKRPIHTADQPIEKSMAESDYGFQTPNHHETAAHTKVGSENEISDSRARNGMGENQNPWIAECDHGAGFLKFPMNTPDSVEVAEKQHAQPLIRAAWLGSFTVNSDRGKVSETFDGLQGYISSKACSLVTLVAEKLPEAIRWEKLPKRCVWPKGFQRQGGPTDDDIAVFFFPSLAKDESAYDSFVFDLIRGDLALRATVMGSELLVFTSVDLPPLFTRFQGKLYLWGVFRGGHPRLV